MSRRGIHRKFTCAVQRQIIFGKNDGVNVVIVHCLKGSAVCKRVFRAVRKGYKHLVCLFYIDGSRGFRGQRYTV